MMIANGERERVRGGKTAPEAVWPVAATDRRFQNGKRFVHCRCPKCAVQHPIYMLWTGRGVPRKYCATCKPLVSSYDGATIQEAAVSAPGSGRKRGHCVEG